MFARSLLSSAASVTSTSTSTSTSSWSSLFRRSCSSSSSSSSSSSLLTTTSKASSSCTAMHVSSPSQLSAVSRSSLAAYLHRRGAALPSPSLSVAAAAAAASASASTPTTTTTTTTTPVRTFFVEGVRTEALKRRRPARRDPHAPADHPPDGPLAEIFAANSAWAAALEQETPGHHEEQAKGQAPRFFWIGCADSRVPTAHLTGVGQGAMFVHRNIANAVSHDDLSCMSALQFAVEVLGVQDILVCGHYKCGGVQAALAPEPTGLASLDAYLLRVKERLAPHRDELDALADDEEEQWNRAVELNTIEQARVLCDTAVVRSAWNNGKDLRVHAIIFELDTGLLKDLAYHAGNPELQGST